MAVLVGVYVPVAGSYSSAVSRKNPPVIRTFPLGSSVEVWLSRADVIIPVALKEGSTTRG